MLNLGKFYGGSRPQGGGFETFSWYYFRISGVILFVLVIIHLLVMHVTTDVACTTYAFVAGRYANPLWRLFDWMLLTISVFQAAALAPITTLADAIALALALPRGSAPDAER